MVRGWIPLAVLVFAKDFVGLLSGEKAPLVGGGVVVDAGSGGGQTEGHRA